MCVFVIVCVAPKPLFMTVDLAAQASGAVHPNIGESRISVNDLGHRAYWINLGHPDAYGFLEQNRGGATESVCLHIRISDTAFISTVHVFCVPNFIALPLYLREQLWQWTCILTQVHWVE